MVRSSTQYQVFEKNFGEHLGYPDAKFCVFKIFGLGIKLGAKVCPPPCKMLWSNTPCTTDLTCTPFNTFYFENFLSNNLKNAQILETQNW